MLKTFCVIILLFLITSINPYFTNIDKGRHPLYPLAGKNKTDIMTNNTPKEFNDNNRIHNFIVSTFAKVDNFCGDNGSVVLKFPLSVYKTEFSALMIPDARVAGFGVFWSGILVISLLMSISIKFNNKDDRNLAILLFLILVLLTAINPYSWWARYIHHLWVLPLFIIFYSFLYDNCTLPKNILCYILILLMYANSIFFIIYSSKFERDYRLAIKSSMATIKQNNNSYIKLFSPRFNTQDYFFETSFLQKLNENNISYEIVSEKYYLANKDKFSFAPSVGNYFEWDINNDK